MVIADFDVLWGVSEQSLFTDNKILFYAARLFKQQKDYSSGVAYLGDGSKFWMLASTHPQYKNRKRELELVGDPNFGTEIANHYGNLDASFVVWGIGQGVKEPVLIANLLKGMGYNSGEVAVAVIDASERLLNSGSEHLEAVLKSSGYDPHVEMVKRPFEVVPKYMDRVRKFFGETGSNITHIVLGNTFFNENISGIDRADYKFQPIVRDCMGPGDTLIVGAQMISGESGQRDIDITEILKEYDTEDYWSLVTHNARKVTKSELSDLKIIFDRTLNQVQFLYEHHVEGSAFFVPLYASGKHTEKEIRRKMRNGGYCDIFLYAVAIDNEVSKVHLSDNKTSLPEEHFKFCIAVAKPAKVRLSDEEFCELSDLVKSNLPEKILSPGEFRMYLGAVMNELWEQERNQGDNLSSNDRKLRLLEEVRELLTRPKMFSYNPRPYDFDNHTRNQAIELLSLGRSSG